MKKLALITGVSGQDGAYLAKLLLEKKYKVVGTDRRSARSSNWRLKRLGIENDIIFEEMELSELVNKSEVSEKFTNLRYLIKSGNKWFYMSQDNNCWISIRYVKNSEDKKIHNVK